MNEERTKRYYKFVAEVLRERCPDLDVVEVEYVSEETYRGGACDSCYYTEHDLHIAYRDSDGDSCSVEFTVTLENFLQGW